MEYHQFGSFEKGDDPWIRVVTVVIKVEHEGRKQFLSLIDR